MHFLLIIYSLFFSSSLLAGGGSFAPDLPHMDKQDIRIEKHYRKVYKNKQIRCWYKKISSNTVDAVGEAIYNQQAKQLSQRIVLTNENGGKLSLSINYTRNDKKHLNFTIQDLGTARLVATGVRKSKYNGRLNLFPSNINSAGIEEFELSKLECEFMFARDKTFELNNPNFHINVHPHSFYDYFHLTTDSVNQYLQKYKSVVLLEDDYKVGKDINWTKFLLTGLYNVELPNFKKVYVKIPQKSALLQSPTGNNKYSILKTIENLNVHYTGGNHNYCMFNNLKYLLEASLKSNRLVALNVHFDPSAIIFQKKGMRKGFSPPKVVFIKNNNTLKYLIENHGKWTSGYLEEHYRYFKTVFFKKYGHMFSTVTFSQESIFSNLSSKLHGTGQGHLTVKFIYPNP